MNLRLMSITGCLFLLGVVKAQQNIPVYLDTSRSIEWKMLSPV